MCPPIADICAGETKEKQSGTTIYQQQAVDLQSPIFEGQAGRRLPYCTDAGSTGLPPGHRRTAKANSLICQNGGGGYGGAQCAPACKSVRIRRKPGKNGEFYRRTHAVGPYRGGLRFPSAPVPYAHAAYQNLESQAVRMGPRGEVRGAAGARAPPLDLANWWALRYDMGKKEGKA